MPKRSSDPRITLRGKFLGTSVAASASLTQLITPVDLDTWLTNESDGFLEYKFTKLSVTAWQRDLTGGTYQTNTLVVGFAPSIVAATPSAVQAYSMPVSACGCGDPGSPWPKINVPKEELLTNAPRWFKRSTTYDDLLEFQGVVYIVNVNGDLFSNVALTYCIDYVIELKGRVPTALTMASSVSKGDTKEPSVRDLMRAIGGFACRTEPPQTTSSLISPMSVSTKKDVAKESVKSANDVPKGYILVKEPV